jgi:1-acyl-sn-glycerol-3-phosphate acyltransferase
MFIGFLKTSYIFFRLLVYYFKSFQKNSKINILKQQFAIEVLKLLGFQLKLSGQPVLKNKLILVGNHISYLDILVLLAVHPESVFLAKSEVAGWPIIGPVAKKIGTVFVVRDSKNSRQDTKLQIEKKLLNHIGTLQIAAFPSGTTTLFEEKPWRKGLFEIAQNTKTDIQPFKISYSHPRECAYIDDDQLFSSLMNLFKLKNKTVTFDWGTSFKVSKLDEQIENTRRWTTSSLHFT